MDNSLYVNLSRQMVLRREMDIIANNIANADTIGFKFESLITAGEVKGMAATMGIPSPVTFVKAQGVARDFGQGKLHRTDAPFDVALDGQGFFKVNAQGGQRFTRDGHFRTDDTGKLVTQSGDPVLDEGGGEIVIDAEKGPVSIASDGAISQANQVVGKIGVFSFDDLSILEKSGDNYFKTSDNTQPKAAEDVKIHQGMLESSNVQPIFQISRMVEVSRAYEQTLKMIDTQGDLSSRAINSLGKVQ